MAAKVFIIHGYTGYPDKNWFPWLKKELETKEIYVEVPAMPHSDAPQLDEWLPHLISVVGTPGEETFFVGHSLGCITILKYLEGLPLDIKVGGAVLVAGFAEPIKLSELNNFFPAPLDDAKIKKSVASIISINSDNDPKVPLWQGEKIKDRFDAELTIVLKGGHLNQKSGYLTFPLVLEKLINLIKI